MKGAAERWSARDLKPSDAAKLWTTVAADIFAPATGRLPEYRKTLRGQFAHYSHCSYDLCMWDLYFSPHIRDAQTGKQAGPYELNYRGYVIDRNAHAIDAHLTAHLLEFIAILRRAYARALERDPTRSDELARLAIEITRIMEKHHEHKCQNVLVPPEWRRTTTGSATLVDPDEG